MVKKPSDIGFSDERYELPELITNNHIVKNNNMFSNGALFKIDAKSITEVRVEQRETERDRCEKAIELAHGKTSVYWCNTNNESDILKSLDSEAVEIRGSHSIEQKEETLKAFANGDIKRIITKAKITGMGLNWQHCNHSVFFPTWSYEQYYQAIRRFWRFGQKSDVTIDLVISEGQTRVMDALKQKTQKANELYENLVRNVNIEYKHDLQKEVKKIILPKF
jgi:superfamily II DNA/RNA helicase